MAERWIEITDANGTRRERLVAGLTRVGGDDADVALAGVGGDQLHVWDDPLRVIFVGRGARPSWEGAAFEERELAPGERFEWAGARLLIVDGTTPGTEAVLEELEAAPAPTAVEPPPPAPDERLVQRIRAGLLVDLELADRSLVKRWQQAVVDGAFDPDACARSIAAGPRPAGADTRVLERAGRLLRDFLMAPTLRGVQGAGRRVRRAARGGVAFVIAQGVALLVFILIVLVAMLLLRVRDVSLDDLLDRILLRN